jgi:hypothetical protein
VGALAAGGAAVAARAAGLESVARWMVCFVLAAMLAVAGWLGFGGGHRACAVSNGFLRLHSAGLCRGAFGLGAILLLVMLVVAVRSLLLARPEPDDAH